MYYYIHVYIYIIIYIHIHIELSLTHSYRSVDIRGARLLQHHVCDRHFKMCNKPTLNSNCNV